jgi:hypothetical protein
MKITTKRVTAVLGSRRFFRLTLAFFVFEALWIALSAVYPMAFDEDFHFGLIKVYSHYWLPFLSSQPPHAAAFGAVARDPSYLYHYLMSFPYRLIALIIHGQTGQVIALRILDIGLFSVGLSLFRRVLLRAKISPALTNLSLLLFVLIPVVPQVAAHINYDDLLFPLVASLCLLTFRANDELRTGRLAVTTLLAFLTLGFIGTEVKYAFAPIFGGALVFLLAVFYKGHSGFKQLRRQLGRSWQATAKWLKVSLLALFVISLGLFAQRDGYNLVKYHTFTPDCAAVVSVQSCKAYGPWASNYRAHNEVLTINGTIHYENPIAYIGSWLYWMWYRLFFAINGPTRNYTNYPPLPLISAAAALIGIAAAAAIIIWRNRIFRHNPYLVFFCLVIGLYTLALWIDGYAQYRYTNELVTMNGRYLLPILLLVAAIAGRAFSLALRHAPVRKVAISVLVVVLFLQGGGFLTFITRSDPSWDWPNSLVVKANDAARKITKPVLVKGSKYYSTRVWFFN